MGRETDALAELLRALKERSGRSYGVLGKRLHVSTSTLHRYCNGTAVPTEYAPLERFARVCGASADELVEVHRRWILADASRRRDAGRPDPGPLPGPVRAEGTAGAAGETDDGATDAVEAGEDADTSGPVRPAARPTSGRGPRAPLAPRLRRPRLMMAAAAAAAAAVAVPTAVIATRGSAAPSARTVADRPAGQSRAAARHGGPLRTTPAPTATRTRTGLTSPAATPGRTVGPSATESAGTSRPGGAPVSPPFHVNVLTDNWNSPCDQWFLLNRDPVRVPPPPAGQATDGWAATLGAVPAGHLRLQVTVQGDGDRPVVLHALRVHVTGTRKAPGGKAYTMGAGCGGDLAPASFAVDLDAPAPNAKAVPGHEGNVATRATDFPYKVSADDPEVLNVDAATVAQDVDWYLELVWSSGDRQGTTRVDDHGRPFRTAGMRGAERYWFDASDGTGAWRPWTG